MKNDEINLEKICRLCVKEETIYLYDLNTFDEDGISYDEKLKFICDLKVTYQDIFPKYICKLCRGVLLNSYDFKTICLSSIEKFSEYLKDFNDTSSQEDEMHVEYLDDSLETEYFLQVDEDCLAENTTSNVIPKSEETSINENQYYEEEYLESDLEELSAKNAENNVDASNTDQETTSDNTLQNTEEEEEEPEPEAETETKPFKLYDDKNYSQDVNKIYKCKVCRKRFSSKLKVKLHMQRIHKQIYLQECKVSCRICGMKFQHTRNLKRHIVYHNVHFSYFACNFCDKRVYSKKSWRQHIKIHNSPINEICKICNKQLRSSVSKVYHMDFHKTKTAINNKTYFHCYTCSEDFDKYADIEEHTQKNHKSKNELKKTTNDNNKTENTEETIDDKFSKIERNFEEMFNEGENDVKKTPAIFKCNLCSIYYENLVEFKNHVNDCVFRIEQPKSFMCDTCGKCFKSAWLLNNHKAGHSSARKFICDICGQSFKWYNDLHNHVNRIHQNIRSYVCNVCGKRCATSATLKSHVLTHSKEKPFKCKICNAVFAQSSTLKEHMYKHTGGQECICTVCKKTFKTKLRLKTHMKRHNSQRKLYPCEICGRLFTEKNSAKKHMIKIHDDVNDDQPNEDSIDDKIN